MKSARKRSGSSRSTPPPWQTDSLSPLKASQGLVGHQMYAHLSACQQWLTKQQKATNTKTNATLWPLTHSQIEENTLGDRPLQSSFWYDEIPTATATQWFQWGCSLCKQRLLLAECQPWYHGHIGKLLLVCPRCVYAVPTREEKPTLHEIK